MILIITLVLKILGIVVPLLIAVAYFTIAKRKIMGAIQRRRGPNVVGYIGKQLNCLRIINILELTSSFCSGYPAAPGKFSMISWFVSQKGETLTPLYASVFAKIILIFVGILGFLYLFVVSKRDNFFVNEVLSFFLKLDIYRKVIFASFTFFVAIPNKFWINSQINYIPLIYLLGFIFPILFYYYIIMYLFLCLESFMFAILYENIKSFKQITNYLLFGNSDHPFAEKYFSWFWGKGNMWRAAAEKVTKVGGAFLATEAKRQHENQQKNDYADKYTEWWDKTKEGFNTHQERADFHKDRRDERTQDNGLIIRFIKWGEDFFSG